MRINLTKTLITIATALMLASAGAEASQCTAEERNAAEQNGFTCAQWKCLKRCMRGQICAPGDWQCSQRTQTCRSKCSK